MRMDDCRKKELLDYTQVFLNEIFMIIAPHRQAKH